MLHLQQVIKTGNKTNEWNQKFGLPFPFAASDISAEYSHSQGKLTIYLKKPGAEIDDSEEHTVTTFTVPADPQTEETKVTVKPEQRPVRLLSLSLFFVLSWKKNFSWMLVFVLHLPN